MDDDGEGGHHGDDGYDEAKDDSDGNGSHDGDGHNNSGGKDSTIRMLTNFFAISIGTEARTSRQKSLPSAKPDATGRLWSLL